MSTRKKIKDVRFRLLKTDASFFSNDDLTDNIVPGLDSEVTNIFKAIDGIFFDEQSDGTANLVEEKKYYNEPAEYSRQQGFNLTISNPGKDVG